jgi:L-fuculose-phosphate aldolase
MLKPGDLVIVDAKGRKVEGSREPSSELKMHLVALARRPDAGACLHAHPTCATTFAVLGIPLAPEILPEGITTIKSVPLAPYATPSTAAVGESIAGLVDEADAILLERHGALTVGADLNSAFFMMETVERFAEIIWRALSVGTDDSLSIDEDADVLGQFTPQTCQAAAGKRTKPRSSSRRKRAAD